MNINETWGVYKTKTPFISRQLVSEEKRWPGLTGSGLKTPFISRQLVSEEKRWPGLTGSGLIGL